MDLDTKLVIPITQENEQLGQMGVLESPEEENG